MAELVEQLQACFLCWLFVKSSIQASGCWSIFPGEAVCQRVGIDGLAGECLKEKLVEVWPQCLRGVALGHNFSPACVASFDLRTLAQIDNIVGNIEVEHKLTCDAPLVQGGQIIQP